jgi:hypothetical protein
MAILGEARRRELPPPFSMKLVSRLGKHQIPGMQDLAPVTHTYVEDNVINLALSLETDQVTRWL